MTRSTVTPPSQSELTQNERTRSESLLCFLGAALSTTSVLGVPAALLAVLEMGASPAEAAFPVAVVAARAAAAAPNRPLGAAAAIPSNVELVATRGSFTKYRLKSNGMPIHLSPNHAAPVITFMVVYHVGSRNEAPGSTGSAHLLEHMLFNKSTENFGRERGHKTFQELLHEAGADFSTTNMTTWNDRMNGYSTVPSDRLELAMRIEADRLGRGLILDKERQPEMSVVRNEFEIGENDPSQALFKAVNGAAIVAHPYHWDTIGYRSDIEGVSTDTLRAHYKNFFWPNNAEAILVGDFDVPRALALFDREFGGFKPSTAPIPRVITVEPPQEGERRVIVRRAGQIGIVQAAYIRPGAVDPDFIPLDVLSTILATGLNSRLYQALVETRLASSVSSYNFPFQDPYPIFFEAVVAPDSNHEKVEGALKAALDAVVKSGVTGEELKRAQKQIEVTVIRSRDGTYDLTQSLGEALASASWEWWDSYIDRMKAVTAADIQRVAARHLVPDHATIGWFVPAATAASPTAAGPAGGGSPSQGAAFQSAASGAKTAPAASADGSGSHGARNGADPSSPDAAASVPKSDAAAGAVMAGGRDARAPAAASSATSTAKSESAASSSSDVTATEAVPFAKRTLRRVLPNKIVLDIVENHAVPTVALQGVILAGRMTAPAGKPALPRLTSMMLERGTKTKDKREIAAALDGAGAQLAFATSVTETTITGSALARDLRLLLETLADELAHPAFRPDEIEKAKAEMKTEVLRASESTSVRAMDRISQLAFPTGHPYRAPATGEMLASLAAATRDDLSAFHRERYTGASLILAISGDVKGAEAAALVESLLGGLPAGARPAERRARTAHGDPAREVVTLKGKANMNMIYGSASGLARNDPDYEAALIANAAVGQDALSSRMGKRVRDTEGLSYSLWSRFLMADSLDGVWLVNVAVAPQNLKKAMVSTFDELAKFCREGITDEEVAVQKEFFAGNYQVRLGSNAGIATALVDAEKFGYGPAYLDEFPGRVRKVTREQVLAAVKAHLRPDRLHLVVAGDLDALPE